MGAHIYQALKDDEVFMSDVAKHLETGQCPCQCGGAKIFSARLQQDYLLVTFEEVM